MKNTYIHLSLFRLNPFLCLELPSWRFRCCCCSLLRRSNLTSTYWSAHYRPRLCSRPWCWLANLYWSTSLSLGLDWSMDRCLICWFRYFFLFFLRLRDSFWFFNLFPVLIEDFELWVATSISYHRHLNLFLPLWTFFRDECSDLIFSVSNASIWWAEDKAWVFSYICDRLLDNVKDGDTTWYIWVLPLLSSWHIRTWIEVEPETCDFCITYRCHKRTHKIQLFRWKNNIFPVHCLTFDMRLNIELFNYCLTSVWTFSVFCIE